MKTEILKIANGYGNVDVRSGVPGGYTHVRGKRLQTLCRRLHIKFAQALVGFDEKGRYGYSPQLDGVVVSSRSAAKLRADIAARRERASKRPKRTPEQLAAARQKRQQRDIEQVAARIRDRFPSMPAGEECAIAKHACVIGSGRVGRSTVADDPVMLAVVAHVRHCYTNYEELLDEGWQVAIDREHRVMLRNDARREVSGKISEIIDTWEQSPETAVDQRS